MWGDGELEQQSDLSPVVVFGHAGACLSTLYTVVRDWAVPGCCLLQHGSCSAVPQHHSACCSSSGRKDVVWQPQGR